MARHPGLTLQKNTYYVRVAVPEAARAVVGKRELIESLRTGDIVEARRVYPEVYKRLKAEIAKAKGAPVPAGRDLARAREALSNWAIAMATSSPAVSDLTLQTAWATQQRIADLETFARTGEMNDRLAAIDGLAEEALTMGGLTPAAARQVAPDFRREIALYAAMSLRADERARLEAALRAAADQVADTDLMDIGAIQPAPPKPLPAPSLTLSVLFDRWMATVTVAEKEVGRLRHQHQRLIEFVGDIAANHLTKDQISEFMALAARFPGRKRPADLNALPIRELVAEYERTTPESERVTLAVTTVEEWFSSYRRAYDHAVAMDWLEINPFDKLKRYVVKGAESVDRRAFSDDEIVNIFTRPLFQGATSAYGYRNEPGPVVTRDHKFWLPILALVHGARLTELAAMPVAHFKTQGEGQDAIHYFDLTDRQVKTVTSERLIPLHPKAVELGFLDYVAERRAAGDKWLFPGLKHDVKAGPGHGFSKWWGDYMNRIGMTDPAITLHSFRHTWKRRARASAVKEEVHDVISGHKSQNVSRGYGEGLDLADLAKAMAKIEFPALPLLPVSMV